MLQSIRGAPQLSLVFLTAIYVCGQWSRFSLAYLSSVAIDKCTAACDASPLPLCPSDASNATEACSQCYVSERAAYFNLRQGACITEQQYSLLVSYGFITLFATAGLFAGRISDRLSRRNIVAASALGASLACALQGWAHNFSTLLLTRVLMGLCTAFAAPASYSMLADLFEQQSLGAVNGVFSLGVYVGGGLSSLTIVVARSVGWRWASRVVALAGLGAALGLLGVVAEPARKSAAVPGAKPRTLSRALHVVWSDKVVVLVFVAAALRFFGGFALGAYLAPYYKRGFPDKNAEFGVLNAFVVSVAGALSAILGGRLADYWARFDVRARGYVFPPCSVLGAARVWVLADVPQAGSPHWAPCAACCPCTAC
jgi:MFS family permease